MAALTAKAERTFTPLFSHQQSHRVLNAEVIYAGAFCGLPGANALTTERGYLVPFQDESTIIWAGIALAQSGTGSVGIDGSVTGDTSASPVVEAATEMGPGILKNVTVTGVSAQTDVMRTSVYASNDNDLTTTANYTVPMGRVQYWYSSTSCDVLVYGNLIALSSLL